MHTNAYAHSSRMINLSINAPISCGEPSSFPCKVPTSRNESLQDWCVCVRMHLCVFVSLFHRVCLICAIRAYSKHFAHHTTVAQLKCRTLDLGIQSPYSTSRLCTAVSFPGMSISLHAGPMVAAGSELVVERGPDW